MDALTRISPHVWQVPFPVGHVYLVALRGDGYAAIDTGLPGSAPAVLDALAALGAAPAALRQIVLTHCHIDHMGSAADLAAATGARVLAGALDAPCITGAQPAPEPCHSPAEQVLHESLVAGFAASGRPPLRPVPVDTALHEGDTLDDWPEPVRVLHVPGHTPGGIALYLPESGLLFPGDVIGTDPAGTQVVLGPFNVDRAAAVASFRRLAALDGLETVCVPHGVPLRTGARAALAAATPETDWL
ncbi:MBL fold metallo-hydrolase [Streptomyces sp. NRRL F-4489]|uniref:MBL fold metallo-hydrolase n=1 Tax=Streptomyces sp. NRRL F-4489 TaxID=1609095 RepID=UPI000747D5E4|nr:MBL fold metallo-hydrolase [Streptomyces sp. NRRL F-4489]KUL37695.1 MBL fold metallo-hydrolase [Streptomyces sp. NRRL F-4489]